MAPRLLHGTLYATIYEVDRINTGCGFNIWKKIVGARKMQNRFLSQVERLVLCQSEIVSSKLYATIDLEKARVGRTRMTENESSKPQWFESFHIYCAHEVSNIIFTVTNNNPVSATLIGRAYLPVEEVMDGYVVDRWITMLDEDHKPVVGNFKIHVRVQFFKATKHHNWSRGIQSSTLMEGVPYTFFKQKECCKVTLYQDAHIPDRTIPHFFLSQGKTFKPQTCWEDIFDAIINAKHLIYITGWSVYTQITLIRDPRTSNPGGGVTLGELLKNKANEGVRVLLLVWGDRTSVETLKREGLIATHDQNTGNYFRNTNVHCVLCPRNPDDGKSIVQGFEVSTMFTHHQKTVVVDSEVPGGESPKRRIMCFVGGIDLCDGRYDTPEHSLFRTLDTTHHDDFHQPNFKGSSIRKGGPREPWHDIHCRLEGPVAWDVLYNFEQRWLKQVGAGNQFLFPINKLNEVIMRPSPITSEQDPETWNVQIFRSIDGGAVEGFPENPKEAAEVGLVTGKDNVIERSIHDAYINAIRRAKNFIYIENPFFLGSSYGWKSNISIKVEDIGALHLIPKELSLKIVSKIEAGERFTVYIVIPMWPEGIPESGSVQAILDWQRRTMEMMYTDIAAALRVKGLKADLREYLTFFCLGNREVHKTGEYTPPEKPEPDTDYSRAQQSRRFMIYVHSKMMIVDDEYIIIGSANINQRSMDGARDSEIAMGGYQPHHLAAAKQPAKGQVYGFRMALWYEHLGDADELLLHPESLECVRALNATADENWKLYSRDTFEYDLPGHLLSYPVAISKNGAISTLPGIDFFPDTKARVLGTKSDYLPPILTT